MAKKLSNPKAVVIYLRVSTEDQGKSHLGLDAQLATCQRLAQYEGLEVLGIYTEVLSGKIDPIERPQFMAAINHCQTTGASLMVAKLDRFSRSVYHVSGFVNGHMLGTKATPRLIVAENPNASEFEINLRASLAQEERRLISERTKAALAQKKAQGYVLGRVGRAVCADKKRDLTSDAIARARELRHRGYSYETVADLLNQEGFTTSNGTPWSKQAVFKRKSDLV